MEAKNDKLSISQKLLCTIMSPLMYNLTNFESSNPEKKSYWQVLREIWVS